MGSNLLCCSHLRSSVRPPTPNSSQGHEKCLEVWKILPKTTALAVGVAEAAQ